MQDSIQLLAFHVVHMALYGLQPLVTTAHCLVHIVTGAEMHA